MNVDLDCTCGSRIFISDYPPALEPMVTVLTGWFESAHRRHKIGKAKNMKRRRETSEKPGVGRLRGQGD